MSILLSHAALIAVLFLTGFRTPPPQLATSVVAAHRIPQFENADVSVWKTVIPTNAPLKLHTHPHARVIVALTGGTMKIAYADGTSETHHWDAGKAYWLPKAEGLKRHADVNIGSKPIEVMVIEVKDAQ
jgi:beta-alanine degradation protein BauB